MLSSPPTIRSCAVALLLGLMAGCASFELPEKIALPGMKDNKIRTPMSMTALWTDTVLVERGVAGFGGRFMFYGSNSEEPIKVDGELTVFAYDDTEDMKQNTVPARKYVFRIENFSKHYSKSSLGHSYSFWIPWDRVGGPQCQVSLIARFKSAKGGVVMSEMTRHLLPGVPPSPVSPAEVPSPVSNPPSRVKQAAHHEAVIAPRTKPRMSTTPITLPEALGAAVQNAPSTPLDTASGDRATGPGRLDRASIEARWAMDTGPPAEAVSSASRSEIQAMVQEAVRDAMESSQQAQRADRFGYRKRRARIAPRLPPTRGPAQNQLHPAARQFGPLATPQAGSAIGSGTSASVPLPPTQPPSAWDR